MWFKSRRVMKAHSEALLRIKLRMFNAISARVIMNFTEQSNKFSL